MKYHSELILKFTPKQMVRMVNHESGSKNLEAVKTNLEALTKLGFNSEQIVSMVSHNGGSKNLEAIKTNLEALTTLGFTSKQIVRMVSHIGGSKNLEAVQDNYTALSRLQFTRKDIVSIIGRPGGSKNLALITSQYNELLEFRLPPKLIAAIIIKKSGRELLIQKLRDLRFITYPPQISLINSLSHSEDFPEMIDSDFDCDIEKEFNDWKATLDQPTAPPTPSELPAASATASLFGRSSPSFFAHQNPFSPAIFNHTPDSSLTESSQVVAALPSLGMSDQGL